MKNADRKMNNKGFSLILVIVCMTLIGVLATMIISMSVSNVQMRVVEEEASDNFYSAEEVLDEIRANLEKTANKALGEAYTLFLQKYAATAPAKREEEFITSLSNELKNKLESDFGTGYDASTFGANYLGVAGMGNNIVIGPATSVQKKDTKKDGVITESIITIKNLSVTYKDDSYETSITTDLVVKVTYPEFFEGNVAGPAFLDYAVITDSDFNVLSGTVVGNVQGSVYSGGSLFVDNGAILNLWSPYVVVKNTVDIRDASTLIISDNGPGLVYASEKNKGIWTQNIVTSSSDLTQECKNELEISNVKCYVQDDLTINGIADSVMIKGSHGKGAYYGYGSGLTNTAEANSAININAKDVNLSIDGINKLWLAGQSFISVPLGYGTDPLNPNKKWGTYDPIMQGESVSFKGNQAAYLLPGDCIEGVWHNPMTLDEYYAATENDKKPLQLSMRKADSIRGDEINLDQYLDIRSETSRYTTAVVDYALGGKMVYIYMNFSTPNAAKKYFEEYYNANPDLVDTRMGTLGKGEIKINVPEENITATGNLVVHSASIGAGGSPNTIINSNTAATDAEVREADYSYSGNFRNLSMTLDAETVYYGSKSDLTDCIFRFDELSTIALYKDEYKLIKGADVYQLYVEDSLSCTIEEGKNCGLVIATGDVYVKADFKGLIIAKGRIFIDQNCTITAAPQEINELICLPVELPGSDPKEYIYPLKDFFTYYDNPDVAKESKEAIDIYFDNWHKN